MSPDPGRDRALEAVIVVASEDDGGMARSVGLLARYLPDSGIHPHVVVHRESPLTSHLRNIDASYEVVPELIETGLRGREPTDRGARAVMQNVRRAPTAIRRLHGITQARHADVLYSHGTWGNYLAAFASLARSAPPLVWHIRNDHSGTAVRTTGRLLARAVPVRSIIAVSRAAGEPYVGLPVRLDVVYNGADLKADESIHPADLRTRLSVGADGVIAGYTGRLVAHKGVDVLLEAFRRVAPRVPHLHLAILGGNPRHATTDHVAALKERAAGWGLASRLHALGYVDDTEPFVREFDFAVVPSIFRDPCPRAVIEALIHGVPVVGSAVGGIPELVREGVNGLLVPPGDPAPLADALLEMAADAGRRRALGQAAAVDGRARFDARVTARAVAAILSDAARARAGQ